MREYRPEITKQSVKELNTVIPEEKTDKIFNNCVNTFINNNNFIFTKHNKPSNNIPSNNIQNSSETRLIVNKYQ